VLWNSSTKIRLLRNVTAAFARAGYPSSRLFEMHSRIDRTPIEPDFRATHVITVANASLVENYPHLMLHTGSPLITESGKKLLTQLSCRLHGWACIKSLVRYPFTILLSLLSLSRLSTGTLPRYR